MKLIVFSAPSGSGKTTIVRELMKNDDFKLSFSISTTSRAKRGQEKDGIDYYFVSVQKFKEDIEQDRFIEWQEVYRDNFYGTYKTELDRIDKLGRNMAFDIDVFGAINIKKMFKDDALLVFVMPPSIEELKSRLEKRGTDSPEKIDIRISKAKQEIAQSDKFDVVVVNDNLESCLQKVRQVVGDFLKS